MRNSKDLKLLEKILKALANKRRLAILEYLKKVKKATVGDLAEEIDLSFKATSKHLAVLFSADIVEREQKSLEMWYSVSASQSASSKAILSLL